MLERLNGGNGSCTIKNPWGTQILKFDKYNRNL